MIQGVDVSATNHQRFGLESLLSEMLHPSPTPIDRLSHSDYCSLSSSDDDCIECWLQAIDDNSWNMPTFLLSHTHDSYQLALGYANDIGEMEGESDVRTWWSSTRSTGVTYKSPQCIVCGERPKTTPPVPNLELAMFLRSLKVEKMTEHDNPAYRENIYDESFSYDDDNCKRIRECRIGVMGASGVGKTSLIRVQYGNDILFSDLLGNCAEACLSNTFMIDIVDSSVRSEPVDHNLRIPSVLVGSKSDLYRKRRVSAYEGQILARHIGCPFLEISAKTNECVNEV
ncbi:hypothetical protein KIN20_016723 [Parelaphostrongylus tenuis]|uniref:small monomeric GTPase n=1 Tax=Parelaphostrongylus tenuis TaxID=148309 RepID=A0AAD5MGV9_PARTN|nr:hypothetical protein KIN20_016723 [Parelaphostrongylus tenuis]